MKILAVCGMGLGSGLILKLQAEKAIKQLGIEADVELADITSAVALAKNVDVILTSKELADRLGNVSAKIVTVSNYLNVQEMVEKLKEVLP